MTLVKNYLNGKNKPNKHINFVLIKMETNNQFFLWKIIISEILFINGYSGKRGDVSKPLSIL